VGVTWITECKPGRTSCSQRSENLGCCESYLKMCIVSTFYSTIACMGEERAKLASDIWTRPPIVTSLKIYINIKGNIHILVI
jgi:hypothetical protein